ncbi:hypothetical protein PR048_024597 [Dryococelus australis]|uniref:Uncharacterized protein n=1 Tax=Dryococelus australis TaxID=614101 RepID=A0ABQ9GP25_9NEOP|nr:hypothetical protein PR048_024597 [Dryococelus australis]
MDNTEVGVFIRSVGRTCMCHGKLARARKDLGPEVPLAGRTIGVQASPTISISMHPGRCTLVAHELSGFWFRACCEGLLIEEAMFLPQKEVLCFSSPPPPPLSHGVATYERFKALSYTEERRAALLARPSAVWWLLLATSSASHTLAPSTRLSAILAASLTFPSRVFVYKCSSPARATRLHYSRLKLDPRSNLRSTQETVAPFEFIAGLEIEMNFISNRRNWRFEILIRDQQPSSTNVWEEPFSCWPQEPPAGCPAELLVDNRSSSMPKGETKEVCLGNSARFLPFAQNSRSSRLPRTYSSPNAFRLPILHCKKYWVNYLTIARESNQRAGDLGSVEQGGRAELGSGRGTWRGGNPYLCVKSPRLPRTPQLRGRRDATHYDAEPDYRSRREPSRRGYGGKYVNTRWRGSFLLELPTPIAHASKMALLTSNIRNALHQSALGNQLTSPQSANRKRPAACCTQSDERPVPIATCSLSANRYGDTKISLTQATCLQGPRRLIGQPACLSPRGTGFGPRPDYPRILVFGNRAGRCRLSTGFLWNIPCPPPLHSGAAPYAPRFTLIRSQDLEVKGRLNRSTHSLNLRQLISIFEEPVAGPSNSSPHVDSVDRNSCATPCWCECAEKGPDWTSDSDFEDWPSSGELFYPDRDSSPTGVLSAERLDCSPPRKANGVHSPAASLRIFASGDRAGRCRWSADFLGDLPFVPPLHCGAAPFSPYLTHVGSQDLVVKSRPNLSTQVNLTRVSKQLRTCKRSAQIAMQTATRRVSNHRLTIRLFYTARDITLPRIDSAAFTLSVHGKFGECRGSSQRIPKSPTELGDHYHCTNQCRLTAWEGNCPIAHTPLPQEAVVLPSPWLRTKSSGFVRCLCRSPPPSHVVQSKLAWEVDLAPIAAKFAQSHVPALGYVQLVDFIFAHPTGFGETHESHEKKSETCEDEFHTAPPGRKIKKPRAAEIIAGRRSLLSAPRAGKTGDLRESPSTRGIVRHDSHMRKPGSDPAEDSTRFAFMGGKQDEPLSRHGPSITPYCIVLRKCSFLNVARVFLLVACANWRHTARTGEFRGICFVIAFVSLAHSSSEVVLMANPPEPR